MKVGTNQFPGKSRIFLGSVVRAFKPLPTTSLYADVFQQVNSRFGPENFAHKEPDSSKNPERLIPKKFGRELTSKETLTLTKGKMLIASFYDFLAYCRANRLTLRQTTEESPLVCLGAKEQFRDHSFGGGEKKLVPITYFTGKEQILDLIPDEGKWAPDSQFLSDSGY